MPDGRLARTRQAYAPGLHPKMAAHAQRVKDAHAQLAQTKGFSALHPHDRIRQTQKLASAQARRAT